MKYHWTVTKVRMIELAKQHMDITVDPRMIDFWFEPRTDWYLEFMQNGVGHHFHLSVFGDTPMLAHRIRRYYEGRFGPGYFEDYNVDDLEQAELLHLGLLQPKGPQQ